MHQDFWREHKLFVEADLVRKIKLFSTADPYVKELASTRGAAMNILRGLMIEHINSGKRTRRLTPWKRSEGLVKEQSDEDKAHPA
jgi:hypothetical protein